MSNSGETPKFCSWYINQKQGKKCTRRAKLAGYCATHYKKVSKPVLEEKATIELERNQQTRLPEKILTDKSTDYEESSIVEDLRYISNLIRFLYSNHPEPPELPQLPLSNLVFTYS